MATVTSRGNTKSSNPNPAYAVPLKDDVMACGRGIGDNSQVPPDAGRQVIAEYPTWAADHHLAQDDPNRPSMGAAGQHVQGAISGAAIQASVIRLPVAPFSSRLR
jgi:hypothetical protein